MRRSNQMAGSLRRCGAAALLAIILAAAACVAPAGAQPTSTPSGPLPAAETPPSAVDRAAAEGDFSLPTAGPAGETPSTGPAPQPGLSEAETATIAANALTEGCLDPFPNAWTLAETLLAAGFVSAASEPKLTLYEQGAVSVVLGARTGAMATITKCTVLVAGMAPEAGRALLDRSLDERRLKLSRERSLGDSVLYAFGSKQAGFATPPLGALVILGPATINRMLSGPGFGVSVVTTAAK